jgi:hypothetical protein
MKKHFVLLLALPALFFLSSCEKEKDADPPKTKTELISTGTWRYSSATVGGINADPLLQACQKDNTLLFVATGTGTVDEGATKCNSGDPQTIPFTWSFANAEAELNVSATLFTGGSTVFNIITLSESQLVLSQTINGQVMIVTFVH